MISFLDTIILVVICGFLFYGLFFGLIRTIGAFFGVLIGAVIASRFYLEIYSWISDFFFGRDSLGKIIVFILLFSIINRIVGFGFYLIDRTYNLLTIIPFLKTINRLGGLILGFVTGSLFVGVVLFVAVRYAFIENWLGQALVNSKFSPLLIDFSGLLMPLLPEVLNKLKSLI